MSYLRFATQNRSKVLINLAQALLSIMVKRGHEVEMEYSKNEIIKKINTYFNDRIVEKIKLITFDGNQKIFKRK